MYGGHLFQGDPVLIVALFQLAAGPAPAPARAAATVVEYLLPRPRAFPHDPAVGRDGIVWYTDQANSYIGRLEDRKSTRLNSSHRCISYAVFCLKKKTDLPSSH